MEKQDYQKTGLAGLAKKATLSFTVDETGAIVQIRTGTRGVDAPNVSDWPDGLVGHVDAAVKALFPEGSGFFVADDGAALRYTRKKATAANVREV